MEDVRVFFHRRDDWKPASKKVAPLVGLLPCQARLKEEPAEGLPVELDERQFATNVCVE